MGLMWFEPPTIGVVVDPRRAPFCVAKTPRLQEFARRPGDLITNVL